MACAGGGVSLYSAPQTLSTKGDKTIEARALARLCREAARDKKAEDVLILDVRNISTITDYLILCSGTSEPHLKAIAEEVLRRAREKAHRVGRLCGRASSRWMVLDYDDVMVHIFHPELRERYALEQLWGDAKRVR
ncbi:MAG: ribosome silencing factor [Verrucomicrobiae bacterium]|nr:ribosome silencing factor [Verrucomicrobiae bacterium]